MVDERLLRLGIHALFCLLWLPTKDSSRKLRETAGMSREIRLDLSTNDHVDLARKSHCHLRQGEIAHTQLRKPEFSDSFSPRRLTAIPSNSEPLMPNSARRRSPASSRGSESRMCRIGHLCSRGRLAVPHEPSHSLSGTEGAASGNIIVISVLFVVIDCTVP